MSTKTININVVGNAGRYRMVVVEAPTTMGTLRFEIQVELGLLLDNGAHPESGTKVAVQDAVIKALAEVVKHPAFGL